MNSRFFFSCTCMSMCMGDFAFVLYAHASRCDCYIEINLHIDELTFVSCICIYHTLCNFVLPCVPCVASYVWLNMNISYNTFFSSVSIFEPFIQYERYFTDS